MTIGALDVSRAYFHADINVPTYVDLPPEVRDKYPGMCWRLNKAMYGTRAAAQSSAQTYGARLKELGFKRAIGNPCCFMHSQKNVRVIVHGDDFVTLAEEEEVKWFLSKRRESYEVKIRGVL